MDLLEREQFLSELESMLAVALTGQGCLALISGEAGIGKTSLVKCFTDAHGNSIQVLWGVCDSLFTPRPLSPLHDIASQLGRDFLDLLTQKTDRQAVFSAWLAELQKRPCIAIFEDVHWADEATLDLIKFVGRRIQRTASLFILTYRDDELSSEHPLRLVLGDLPATATNRLKLSGLSASSVFSLASAANQAERATQVFQTTNGNPFFVTEILASKGVHLPSTIRDAVLARAARLSPAARAVLEVASVIGLHIEPWLLTSVAGVASEAVQECIAGGMLQFQGDDYAFRHELARQTILETVAPERKLALHRMILSELKESSLARNDLARLASHAEGTKDASAVLEYAPAAARQASAASSHREAIALYELALQFADSLPPAVHARTLEAYITELLFANRFVDTVNVLKKAIELWHSIGDRLREGNNLASLTQIYYVIGQKAEAEQAGRSAITILEALPASPELAQAYRGECYIRMEDRDCAEAVIWGEKAIALAERFNDADTLARACNYSGCAMMALDYDRGCALMERSLAIGREANLPFAFAGALANFSQMLLELYHLAEAEHYLAQGLVYATEHDDEYHRQGMFTLQALLRLYQGRWAEGIPTASGVLQQSNVDPLTRTYALLVLGRIHIRQGDADALPILNEALALSIQADAIVRLGTARAALAEAAWLRGDYDLAAQEAGAAYDLALNKKHPWIAGELAFWRWRAGDNFRTPTWIAVPYALQIAGDWRDAAAEWERRGCPYEQALALMDGDEAARLAALDIFERLGARPAMERLKYQMRSQGMRGIPRGHRPSTRQNRFNLTTRELEVLDSLVDGPSNPAIARKLSLSTRTVEHHIASILQKMQVESRHEAVALALKENLVRRREA